MSPESSRETATARSTSVPHRRRISSTFACWM
jgi:hypothetical protein